MDEESVAASVFSQENVISTAIRVRTIALQKRLLKNHNPTVVERVRPRQRNHVRIILGANEQILITGS